MGYKLRREIEDLFPGPCTPAERLVGLEIADYGSESTRISLIPLRLLCSRTGLSPQGVKKALQRLLTRGLEFRLSHGNGTDGRPVYTARGAEIEYRVPCADEFLLANKLAEGGTTGPLSLPDGPWDLPVDKPP